MAVPDHRALRAGALRADYGDGDLWHIRYGDLPVLDRLYVRIRAADWATEPMRSQVVTADQSRRSFWLVSHLRWGEATPWATGTLDVLASPAALRARVEIVFHDPVAAQRAGFNLHHPLTSTIGRPFRWRDGQLSRTGRFPRTIYPQYWDGTRYLPMIGPFDELAVRAGARTEVLFTFRGARFETEDQRNWTDASFKTYGPPVAGTRPRLYQAGSRIRQDVRVQIRGTPAVRGRRRSAPAAITIGAEPVPPLPAIGATTTAAPVRTGDAIDHLRAEVWPGDPRTTGSLRRMAVMLREQGIALELALRIGRADPVRLGAVLDVVRDVPLRGLAAIGPDTDPTADEVTAMVRDWVKRSGIPVPVAAGTAGHFSEVNRARDAVRDADLVVWSTSPQVHATDDDTVMGAAAIVGQTVASATRIWPAKGVAVSPVRLGRPADPSADPRAGQPFAAAWLVAVLAGLAGTRCEWITLDLPLAPVYHVLRAVRRSRGYQPVRARSPHDHGLAVLAARQRGRARLLIAELRGQNDHRLTVPGKISEARVLGGPRHGLRLDVAGREWLALGGYEVAAVSLTL